MKSTKTNTKNTAKGGARVTVNEWLTASALLGFSCFAYRYTFRPATASPEENRRHAVALVREWKGKGFAVVNSKTMGDALARIRPGQAVIVTGCGRGLPVRVVGMRETFCGGGE